MERPRRDRGPARVGVRSRPTLHIPRVTTRIPLSTGADVFASSFFTLCTCSNRYPLFRSASARRRPRWGEHDGPAPQAQRSVPETEGASPTRSVPRLSPLCVRITLLTPCLSPSARCGNQLSFFCDGVRTLGCHAGAITDGPAPRRRGSLPPPVSHPLHNAGTSYTQFASASARANATRELAQTVPRYRRRDCAGPRRAADSDPCACSSPQPRGVMVICWGAGHVSWWASGYRIR